MLLDNRLRVSFNTKEAMRTGSGASPQSSLTVNRIEKTASDKVGGKEDDVNILLAPFRALDAYTYVYPGPCDCAHVIKIVAAVHGAILNYTVVDHEEREVLRERTQALDELAIEMSKYELADHEAFKGGVHELGIAPGDATNASIYGHATLATGMDYSSATEIIQIIKSLIEDRPLASGLSAVSLFFLRRALESLMRTFYTVSNKSVVVTGIVMLILEGLLGSGFLALSFGCNDFTTFANRLLGVEKGYKDGKFVRHEHFSPPYTTEKWENWKNWTNETYPYPVLPQNATYSERAYYRYYKTEQKDLIAALKTNFSLQSVSMSGWQPGNPITSSDWTEVFTQYVTRHAGVGSILRADHRVYLVKLWEHMDLRNINTWKHITPNDGTDPILSRSAEDKWIILGVLVVGCLVLRGVHTGLVKRDAAARASAEKAEKGSAEARAREEKADSDQARAREVELSTPTAALTKEDMFVGLREKNYQPKLLYDDMKALWKEGHNDAVRGVHPKWQVWADMRFRDLDKRRIESFAGDVIQYLPRGMTLSSNTNFAFFQLLKRELDETVTQRGLQNFKTETSEREFANKFKIIYAWMYSLYTDAKNYMQDKVTRDHGIVHIYATPQAKPVDIPRGRPGTSPLRRRAGTTSRAAYSVVEQAFAEWAMRKLSMQ